MRTYIATEEHVSAGVVARCFDMYSVSHKFVGNRRVLCYACAYGKTSNFAGGGGIFCDVAKIEQKLAVEPIVFDKY